MFTLCMLWIFFLCSVPSIATGLCAGHPDDHGCYEALPSLMVCISNVSAFLGRLLGGALSACRVPAGALYMESATVALLGILAVLYAQGLSSGVPFPLMAGGAMSAAITGWCNLLLMRLSALAQRGASHSVGCPCPVTAQITWVAIQSGCVGGSILSFMLKIPRSDSS